MNSTPAADNFTVTPNSTVGAIVAARPVLARVFQRLGIDYCCGGKIALGEACVRQELDPKTVVAMLDAAASLSLAGQPEVDAAAMTLTQLADHIETTHHEYVKAELPRLLEMAERVARKHTWKDARLSEVHATLVELTDEMFSHMQKEEQILFPLVRLLEAGTAGRFNCGSVENPIRQMELEHESAGGAVARLRELTDGFMPDAEACNTHRGLLAGLEEFEADLHQHVHKENNVLFPRAMAFGR